MVSNLHVHQNTLEGCQHRFLDCTARASDSLDLGWGPRVCIPKKFPGDAETQLDEIMNYVSNTTIASTCLIRRPLNLEKNPQYLCSTSVYIYIITKHSFMFNIETLLSTRQNIRYFIFKIKTSLKLYLTFVHWIKKKP